MAMLLSGFIYSSEGQEIYLRRPSHYNLPDKCLSFAEVGGTAPYDRVESILAFQCISFLSGVGEGPGKCVHSTWSSSIGL